MSKKHILLVGYLIGAIFFLGIMPGCWSRSKKQSEPTPEYLYNNGITLLQKKKYDQAAESFTRFKEEFPLHEMAPMADLRLGDANYLNKKYGEAIVIYEEFKKLHPLHPEIPYTVFQLGNCHFKQLSSMDRDQTETERAIEQYRYLIENYPQSPYAEHARRMMRTCQKQLADRELYVAEFYVRTKKYGAALGRLEGVRQKYPDFGLDKDVNRLSEICRKEMLKEEQKKKAKEEKEERKKKEREKKKAGKDGSSVFARPLFFL